MVFLILISCCIVNIKRYLRRERASFKMTHPSCSNDATQSDDEEKLQSQQTDTDGGRLKQKT